MAGKLKYFQTYESVPFGLLLAVSGGLMDAYSYLCRGKVFANAQTGNMLLFGVHLVQGNILLCFRYFCPIAAFITGITLAEIVQQKFRRMTKVHWAQIELFLEAIILIFVAVMPQSTNLIANTLISFVCGMQVESFRKLHGNPASTTMCIGNLRYCVQHFNEFLRTGDSSPLFAALIYLSVICSFIFGAVIGSLFIPIFEEKTIIASSLILLITMFMARNDPYGQHS